MKKEKALLAQTCLRVVKHTTMLLDKAKQTNDLESIEILLDLIEQDNQVLTDILPDLLV